MSVFQNLYPGAPFTDQQAREDIDDLQTNQAALAIASAQGIGGSSGGLIPGAIAIRQALTRWDIDLITGAASTRRQNEPALFGYWSADALPGGFTWSALGEVTLDDSSLVAGLELLQMDAQGAVISLDSESSAGTGAGTVIFDVPVLNTQPFALYYRITSGTHDNANRLFIVNARISINGTEI